MASPTRLVIASRESRLAMWQARHVQSRLRALYPDCAVEILGMTTEGDRVLDRALSEIGGKGLFTKELEVAILDGRADLAVHSLKDVPMQLAAPFALSAVMVREDPRDAFVSTRHASLEAMPAGAVVGTSSLRRAAQIRRRLPHLEVRPLRGNLDTRLAKLDRGEYDAIVLAAAGLKRLGLADRIRALIPESLSLPAAGQGALGIETLAARTDVAAWIAPLAHAPTWQQVSAERAVSRVLGGSCRVPLAAYCVPTPEGGLHLRACIASLDGGTLLEADARCAVTDLAGADALGVGVAQALIAQGAQAFVPDAGR
ncbi:MAG TPA: hydroxymethylbilane synthase [Quisquiliibacterium sp.]|nr:hydroxymethylbilane synthase [Quisquiliibacterium sp.]HPA91022.1 hydroxymethylbilane synthase [Quisquiliibacterium sp.]HQN11532.1 hydroxymethylbilane synthase [Quisquiliibacterium sp.]